MSHLTALIVYVKILYIIKKEIEIMHSFLQNLLADKTGGEIFRLFSGWHFLYVGLTAAAVVLILLLAKGKEKDVRVRITNVLITIAFSLYIADFFLMPLAYGEIDIEKLPFHACTSMCVMCFISHHNKFLEKYRSSLLMLGFLSNIVYLIYPAGVMWYAVHPLSYRVIQTLLFHSAMTTYCLISLIFNYDKIKINKCHRDLIVVVGLTVWALIGSYVYSGAYGGGDRYFNWFFVVRDPFNAIPESISVFLMPFLNIAAFFAVEMIIHLIIFGVQKKLKKDNYIKEETK